MDRSEFSKLLDDQYYFLEDVAWNENVHFFSGMISYRISLRPLEKHKSYPNSDILNTKLFMYFIYQGLADVGKFVIDVNLKTHSFLFNEEYKSYALDDKYKKDILNEAIKITNKVIEENNIKIILYNLN
jgi:hypothetical protein